MQHKLLTLFPTVGSCHLSTGNLSVDDYDVSPAYDGFTEQEIQTDERTFFKMVSELTDAQKITLT
jgi:hypothetical protein